MLKIGKIKIYDKERGFGFIVTEDGDIDIFFHISDMPHKHILPRIDETVTFEIIDYESKQKAANITRLNVFPNQLPKGKRKKLHSNHKFGCLLFIGGLLIINLIVVSYFKYQRIQETNNQKLEQRQNQ